MTRSEELYKKFAPIDREHQPKKDGTAPDSVLAERDLFMATFNVENSGPQSMDSFKTYIESYLAAGKGARRVRGARSRKPATPATTKQSSRSFPTRSN